MILDYIRLRIIRIANNEKERDVLSLLYITWLIIMGVFVIKVAVFDTLSVFMVPIFKSMVTIWKSALMGGGQVHSESIELLSDINFIFGYLELLIPTTISFIYIKYFEKLTFKTEAIYIVLNIVMLMLLFSSIRMNIFLTLVLLLFVLIFPLGKGKYFSNLSNLRYIYYIWLNYKGDKWQESRKNNLKNLIKKTLALFILCFTLAKLTSDFLGISIYLSILIYLAFAVRLFLANYKSDKVLIIFQKSIIYIFVLLINIILNFQLENYLDKIFGLLITFYFTWDRIFSLSKEIQQIIDEQGALYYYEDSEISVKKLSREYMSIKFIDEDITEIDLVIQILIRFNFLEYKIIKNSSYEILKKEMCHLCKIYKNKYDSYSQIIGYIDLKFNNSKRDSIKNELIHSFSKEKQKIYSIDLIMKYICYLYTNKDHVDIINTFEMYLLPYIKILDIDMLNILEESYNTIGENEKAKEIHNFIIKVFN